MTPLSCVGLRFRPFWYLLDGFEPLLQFLGMDGTDTYITRHEVDDLFTVVHIDKEAAPWQQ